MHLLVTGAQGFIGSAMIRHLLNEHYESGFDYISKITAYARNTSEMHRKRLTSNKHFNDAIREGYLRLLYGDLNWDLSGLCEGVDAVVHFAAKTFVDHSIVDPIAFVQSNVVGTVRLLEEAVRHRVSAFVQISTDEVYGQILRGGYSEEAPPHPRNPYAASKLGADGFAIAFYHSFDLWTAVCRTENNYGPFQHPQKAIPVFIGHASRDQKLPVYGSGDHVRQWLYVSDHVKAIVHILRSYVDLPPANIWHIAGSQELTNNELARRILRIMGKPEDMIKHIDDSVIRPGHDKRYALCCDKLRGTGWEPEVGLDEGLERCVKWYLDNPAWLG